MKSHAYTTVMEIINGLFLLVTFSVSSTQGKMIPYYIKVSEDGTDNVDCIRGGTGGRPTPPPCKTLHYVFQHLKHNAQVEISCGHYQLYPHDNHTQVLLQNLMNVFIKGHSTHDCHAVVECVGGASLGFYSLNNFSMWDLTFEQCGNNGPLIQTSAALYFHHCKHVSLLKLKVTVRAGHGIAVVEPQGELLIHTATVVHNGTWGSGIHVESTSGNNMLLLWDYIGIENSTVKLINCNLKPTSYNSSSPPKPLNGITVVLSLGEEMKPNGFHYQVGRKLKILNVIVISPFLQHGKGIYLRCLNARYDVELYNIHINHVEQLCPYPMEESLAYNTTDSRAAHGNNCCRNFTSDSSPSNDSVPEFTNQDDDVYTGLYVALEGKSLGVPFTINVLRISSRGRAMLLVYRNNAENYVMNLVAATFQFLSTDGQLNMHERHENDMHMSTNGLHIQFNDAAINNTVQIVKLLIAHHQAEIGGGIKVEFKDRCLLNKVVMANITCKNNSALKGGGLALMFTDFSGFNRVVFVIMQLGSGLIFSQLLLNAAEEGGGLFITFTDKASNNTVRIHGVGMFDNMATKRGGGFHCAFEESTTNNTVKLSHLGVFNNYVPLTNITFRHRMQNNEGMGGGGHVDFSADSGIIRTHNEIKIQKVLFIGNSVERGVGGGLSMVYRGSAGKGYRRDTLICSTSLFLDNIGTYGSGIALLDITPYDTRKYPVTAVKLEMILLNIMLPKLHSKMKRILQKWKSNWNSKGITQFSGLSIDGNGIHIFTGSFFMQKILKEDETIIRAWKTNECMMYTQSVTVHITTYIKINCVMRAQGIRAVNSQFLGSYKLNVSVQMIISQCVAINGGAMALYGQSNIKVLGGRLEFDFHQNVALRRGGAIYVDNVREQNPSNGYCSFIQTYDSEKLLVTYRYGFNIAGENGNFAYIKDINDCLSETETSAMGIFDDIAHFENDLGRINNSLKVELLHWWNISDYDEKAAMFCKVFGYMCPENSNQSHISGAPIKVAYMDSTIIEDIQELMNNPPTVYAHPGIEQQLPFNYTLDQLNNTIDSVFAVQVLQRTSDGNLTRIQLNPFSRFTSDFKVIVHGIPLKHHMLAPHVNISSLHPQQLLLQSVDNEELVLVVNIQMECCPPGYIFTQGTCQCGLLHSIQGIKTCSNVNLQEVAILNENVWAGFVDSQHPSGCNGLLLYTAKCPLDYCHNQPLPLPNNHSKEKLNDCVCGRNNRNGLLCGDCLSGYSININFGGSTPKCTQCSGPLSKAGILMWILAEWIPMLLVVVVVLLFNVDIVSGYFNSFLLFAQLIAFSSIRGDPFNTPQVYKVFASIYRFIYGIWNLDFFGQLLPPYCLTPNDRFNTLQIVLLQNSVGVFPLVLTIALVVLERSAEKWICCHPLNKCLRRFRKWTAKFSGGQTYDRALPAFVILGFTRFLVSSSYVLVSQTITSIEGETTVVVWWQGTMPYGSAQHLAYFIPAILILFLFVFLPFIFLLTLPLGPQIFGKLIYSVPILKCLCGKLQSLWSDLYTDKWMYHFINVFQGCYRDRFRFVSSFFLGYRIALFFAAILVPRIEDSLRIQLLLAFLLLLFVATFQPYKKRSLNVLDVLMLGDLVLVLLFSMQITDNDSLIGDRQVYAYIQFILIYLPLIYPLTLIGRKIYSKRDKFPKCMRRTKKSEDGRASPLLGNPPNPRDLLGPIVDIHELHLVLPSDGETTTADGTTTGEATNQI